VRKLLDTWLDLFERHEVLTRASAIAFQALTAAVVLVLLGLAVLGEIGRQDLWFAHIAPQIKARVLPGVYDGVDATVRRIFSADSAPLLAFAAVFTIWEMSGAVRCCMGAFTRIYEVREHRSTWLRTPLSYVLATALTAAFVAAALLVMALGGLVHGGWYVPFAVVRWALAIGLLALAFGLIVRFAPARPRAKRWASIGTGLVVFAWTVQSLIFGWYVSSVANFKTAVGSLAVLLVVITYFYVASIVLLVGIELDEQLRKRSARP
jgi:membrane protein